MIQCPLNILEFRKRRHPRYLLPVRKYYKTAKLSKFSRALLENVKEVQAHPHALHYITLE